MDRNGIIIFSICFLFGVVGGVISRIYWSPASSAHAAGLLVQAQELRLYNSRGQNTGVWFGQEKNPGLFLYDSNYRSRLEVGLFPDGRPVMALNDEKHLCKLLTKLEWAQNIPMFFMKEPADRNRLIMALDLKNSDASFLVLFNSLGQKREIFGNFEMP